MVYFLSVSLTWICFFDVFTSMASHRNRQVVQVYYYHHYSTYSGQACHIPHHQKNTVPFSKLVVFLQPSASVFVPSNANPYSRVISTFGNLIILGNHLQIIRSWLYIVRIKLIFLALNRRIVYHQSLCLPLWSFYLLQFVIVSS